MESKKFILVLQKDEEVVFEYTSKKNDSLVFSEKNYELSLKLKGDQCKSIEQIRFNNAIIEHGKNKLNIGLLTYTKILDNGFTLLNFNTTKIIK